MSKMLSNISDLVAIFSKLAGRIDDAKERFPEVDVEELSRNDPSGNNKYLLWMSSQMDKGHTTNDLYPTVRSFHNNQHRFKIRDLYQYKDLKDLEDAVKDLKPSKREEKQEIKSTAAKIYEDEYSVIIRPDTKGSCVEYGRGTRWCITMQNEEYYEQYTMSNVVFYFVLRKEPAGDRYDKIAFAYQRGTNNEILSLEIFDAEDSVIGRKRYQEEEYGRMHQRPVQIPDNFAKFVQITESDATSRPKAPLAKLNDTDHGMSPEELLQIYNTYSENTYSQVRAKVVDLLPEEYLQFAMNDKSRGIRERVSLRIPEEYVNQIRGINTSLAWVNRFENYDKRLLVFIEDPDSEVRLALVRKLVRGPYADKLHLMVDDESSHIRRVVAENIEEKYLVDMRFDDNVGVREAVAERISKEDLLIMRNDALPQVRRQVAQRLEGKHLVGMMDDTDDSVRVWVSRWIPEEHLVKMIDDESVEVRENVVERVPAEYVGRLLFDHDMAIRTTALDRISRKDFAPHAAEFISQNRRTGSMKTNIVRKAPKEMLPKLIDSYFMLDADTRAEMINRLPIVHVLKRFKHWAIDDKSPLVRYMMAKRIPVNLLPKMMKDKSSDVRKMVASRIPVEYLSKMLYDESPEIADIARHRRTSEEPVEGAPHRRNERPRSHVSFEGRPIWETMRTEWEA